MEKISGVYIIRNIINGKVYIGSSKDITHRWSLHKSDLNKNKHHSRHLQTSWNKYGKENFEFKILEKVNEDILCEIEQKYIEFYKSHKRNNGYNINPNAGSSAGRKVSEETKKKASDRMKLKWVKNREKMLEGIFKRNKKEWIKNLKESLKVNGSNKGTKNPMFGKGCKKVWIEKYGEKTALKMWDEVTKKNSKSNSKENNAMWGIKRPNVGIKNSLLKGKKILQFDLDGNLLKEWDSINQAVVFLKTSSCLIRRCIKKQLDGDKFIWKLKNNSK